MQSVLEHEVRRLWFRLREWMAQRDRAVLFGALLCGTPFLPITFLGVIITVVNLVLLGMGKLPRAELPLLVFGLLMSVFYIVLWWALFTFVIGSGLWLVPARIWSFLLDLVPLRPRGLSISAGIGDV